VYLKCSTPSLEDRVANQERQAMNKLSSVDRLKSILSSKNYGAIPYENCLEIDSDSSSAESNARRSTVQPFNRSTVQPFNLLWFGRRPQ